MSAQRAADDFDEIRKRLTIIQGERSGYCAVRAGLGASTCWCYQAGPDGKSLSCPAPVIKPEIHDEFSCGLRPMSPKFVGGIRPGRLSAPLGLWGQSVRWTVGE
jgi:hypothetical protein